MKKLTRENNDNVGQASNLPRNGTWNSGFGLVEFLCAAAVIGIIIVLGIWQYFIITENVKISKTGLPGLFVR